MAAPGEIWSNGAVLCSAAVRASPAQADWRNVGDCAGRLSWDHGVLPGGKGSESGLGRSSRASSEELGEGLESCASKQTAALLN